MIDTELLKTSLQNNIKNGEPRVVADDIEQYIKQNIDKFVITGNTTVATSRLDMKDVGFIHNNIEYIVDIKTHNTMTTFNMPNITSVSRLMDLYKDTHKEFSLLIVKYSIGDSFVNIQSVAFGKIWNISTSCFRFGNLGTGQLQLKNSNNIEINNNDKREWFKWFYLELYNFYQKEERKIQKRKDNISLKLREYEII